MSIDAAHDEEPEPGPVTCGQVRARMDGLADEFAALMTALAADRDRPDLARRVTALTVAFREARAQMAGHVFTDALTTEKTTAPPGRHAAPPRRGADVIQLRPRRRRGAVHGLAPAAVAATLAGHGTRHAITAHFRLGLTAAAAAGVTAAGVTYTIQTAPDVRPSVPLPAISAPAAAPAAVADPTAPRLVKRHRRHAHRAAPVLAAPAAAPPATTTPPAPPPGVLNIQQATVTLYPGRYPGLYSGQVTLYATGGPARWRVDWLGTSAAIQADQDGGVIPDGQQATITITVDAAAARSGPWTLTLDPGGQQITITAAG